MRSVASQHDPSSEVGVLFPGSSDVLFFTLPEYIHTVLDFVRAKLFVPDGPLAAYQLDFEDVHVTSSLIALPLHHPPGNILNAVWKDLHPPAPRSTLPRELDDTLQARQLRVALQPIVDLQHRGILGYEALIRGPLGSSLEMPDCLFRAAETYGRLDVLEDLCRHAILTTVPSHLRPGVRLFMNVHPRRDPWDVIATALKHGVSPARLVLEVSEQVLLIGAGRTVSSLRRCQKAGASIALDDVGRAYTGLPVLSLFPWNYLKMDRSLLLRAMEHERDRALLQRIIQYARETSAQTIIEGIEDDSQRTLSMQMGATWGQGYYLGRPCLLDAGAGIVFMHGGVL